MVEEQFFRRARLSGAFFGCYRVSDNIDGSYNVYIYGRHDLFIVVPEIHVQDIVTEITEATMEDWFAIDAVTVARSDLFYRQNHDFGSGEFYYTRKTVENADVQHCIDRFVVMS